MIVLLVRCNAHPAADHVRVPADERPEEARPLVPALDADGSHEKPEPRDLAVLSRARETLHGDVEGATGQLEELLRIDSFPEHRPTWHRLKADPLL